MTKVALVTGANTGIGLAIAERLLADGYALGYATAGKDESYKAPLDELRVRYGDDRIAWVYGDLAESEGPGAARREDVRRARAASTCS